MKKSIVLVFSAKLYVWSLNYNARKIMAPQPLKMTIFSHTLIEDDFNDNVVVDLSSFLLQKYGKLKIKHARFFGK